jgi:hypothetical protein
MCGVLKLAAGGMDHQFFRRRICIFVQIFVKLNGHSTLFNGQSQDHKMVIFAKKIIHTYRAKDEAIA